MFRWVLAALAASGLFFIAPVVQDNDTASASSPELEQEVAALLGKQQISLTDLFRLAELKSPKLEAAQNAVRARAGRTQQASAYPNPNLEFEVEEMSTEDSGIRKDKIALVQPLVLSRRRGAAVAAAQAEQDAATFFWSQTRREIFQRLHSLWAEQLYIRQARATVDSLLAVARRTLEIAETRLDARAAPETHVTKALLEVYDLEVTLQNLSAEQARNAAELKALLGGIDLSIERLTGRLDADNLQANAGVARQEMNEHPAILSATMNIHAATAMVRQAKAQRLPDLGLYVAYGRTRPENEGFVEAGVSFPLPIFNRYRGSITASKARVAEARNHATIVENDLEVALGSARARFQATRDELEAATELIRPAAERGLTQAQEAYRVGRLPFLELIDAQRTLSQVRLRQLQLRKELVIAQAELMSLLGTGPYAERGENP